jgi:hypothetical protein
MQKKKEMLAMDDTDKTRMKKQIFIKFVSVRNTARQLLVFFARFYCKVQSKKCKMKKRSPEILTFAICNLVVANGRDMSFVANKSEKQTRHLTHGGTVVFEEK